MTWTKLGSEFITDPVMLALPRGARLLHIEATIWSNQHGTDGRIPAHVLRRISDEDETHEAAKALIAAGLWSEQLDGWLIADFLENQPSAEDVERTRHLDRQRQRRKRQHRNGDHSLCDTKYCRTAVTRDVPRDVPRESVVSHDTRTDPIRTEPFRKNGDGEVRGSHRRDPVDATPDRIAGLDYEAGCDECERQ
jgi:hypothetical protein